jgi:hypothetical protein
MTASIFISFASQDLKVANTLCKALESRGFKCWIASRDIAPGENFQIAIVRAIRNAKIMLLVFTGNSNNSDEMAKELALASQSKLIVVPLRIDDVRPNEAFSYEFATRQWIDFFADWETAIEQLAQRIGMALGDGANAAPPEPASAPPVMPAPTPDVIMEALAAQPAEVAKPLGPPPGDAAGKTALLTPAEVATAKPAPGSAGPSSFQPEAPAKRGAPVMLFVALGVLVIALGAGAAVLLPSFLAKKPVPTAATPTNAATSLALTPAPPPTPALVTQPTAATPGPAPMASGTPDPGAAGAGPNGGYLGPSSEQPVQPSAAPSPAQEDPDLDPETHRGGRSHPRRGGGGGGGAGGGGSADVPF